jgi:hypothetical protein
MPKLVAMNALPAAGSTLQHRRMAQETAALLASLIRNGPASGDMMAPEELSRLLSNPAALSALVRRAGLESAIAESGAEAAEHTALQHVLNRVSPQHLSRLLAVLQEREQPAVNHDATYGESASLGDPGSGRPVSRAEMALRELWGHGAPPPASGQADAAGESEIAVPYGDIEDDEETGHERAGWNYHAAPAGPLPQPFLASAWHPAIIGGALALALLLPVVLVMSSG